VPLKDGALGGESVDVRRSRQGIAHEPQRVPPQIVREDEHEIRAFFAGEAEATERERQQGGGTQEGPAGQRRGRGGHDQSLHRSATAR